MSSNDKTNVTHYLDSCHRVATAVTFQTVDKDHPLYMTFATTQTTAVQLQWNRLFIRQEDTMLTVNDLMTQVPNTVTPETPLRNVIGLMKTGGYRQIPVLNKGKLVGMITDRDIRLVMNSPMVLHERAQDEDILNEVIVESCMTPNPITVTPDTPAYRAAEILSMYKFGALPVVDEDTLVGIITVTDYLRYFSTNYRES